MAGVAIRWRTLENIVCMTTGTGSTGVFPGQWEMTVVEIGWQPPAGGMAERAIRPVLPVVFIIFLVAAGAVRWRALVNVIDVTICASRLGMFTRQLEGRYVVVEGCRQPATGGMAAPAGCAQQARMRILA
jgi:hypothetical protein